MGEQNQFACQVDTNINYMAYNTKEKQRAFNRRYYLANKVKMMAQAKAWGKVHPEVITAISRRWRKVNPDKTKNARLKYLYKISLSDYQAMFVKQGGVCAICKKQGFRLNGTLCVDHCHDKNSVRGLLCDHCNLAIGLIRDDIDFAKNIVSYLIKHKEYECQP